MIHFISFLFIKNNNEYVGSCNIQSIHKKIFATGYMNRLTYLYPNGYYWSMSPFDFYSGDLAAHAFLQHATGFATNNWVTSGYGLRPVINLQSDVAISSQVILV